MLMDNVLHQNHYNRENFYNIMPIFWHKNGASMPMTCKRKSDTIVLSTSGFFF